MINTPTDDQLFRLAESVGQALLAQGRKLATAESCTGGWVAKAMTDVMGSSAWFERGFVTYTNIAKKEMLGVSTEILDEHGAVSESTARAMSEGALEYSRADMSLAISGVAGPGGGTPYKPVGLVCFAWCSRGQKANSEKLVFDGDREAIRRQAVGHALRGMLARMKDRVEHMNA